MKTRKPNSTRKVKRATNRLLALPEENVVSGRSEPERLVHSPLKLRSILVPIDFSKPSKKALAYAIPFAEQFGAKITLLFVVEPVVTPDLGFFPLAMEDDRVIEGATARLNSLCKQADLDPKLLDQPLVRHGSAFHEIVDAARSLKVDLIIVSTRGYSGLKHILLGSTTERVVRHAPCPVLVVREREHEFV
jgi:nucleotide-binding universal stress UspA family protein